MKWVQQLGLLSLFLAIGLATTTQAATPTSSAFPKINSSNSPNSNTNNGGANSATGTIHSDKANVDFSKANPEDITNENFPNLIESFDYPNADIAEVVKAISKLTGKNFILEKGLTGKISIIAPSQITVAEAYKAFLTALAMNNYTVVPSGSFLKIRSLSTAAKESIDTYAGSYFPNADQLITRIIKLKYISAEEVQKTLRAIVNQNGDITPYIPTNSLIVTDMGSNIERISTIINQLDVPGFEEKLVVINIKFARSKDMADLIDKIINKGDKSSSTFNSGIPRFRPMGSTTPSSGSGAANYSLVIPDTRTNSIIVVGNDAGIERIRGLVAKLDFRIRPEDGGGVYVYYVRYGDAEKIANVLNGIASDSTKKAQAGANGAPAAPVGGATASPMAATEPVFGGDVKVTADKDNNSLVITAIKQDYEMVRSILARIDIPRDQVLVKAIFLEMNATNSTTWGINYFKFIPNTNGVGRSSLVTSSGGVASLTDFTQDKGLTLGWGSSDQVSITPLSSTGTALTVPSLLALIQFIKATTDSNVLSTPQLSALDNEDAEIEVGNNVPVSNNQSFTQTGQATSSIDRKDLTLKMKITPHISPDTDAVRMKIDAKVQDITQVNIAAANIASNAIAYSTRSIITNIVVNSADTAVLGGLMKDQELIQVVKVPILGDIPILGWLFKGKSTSKQKLNLLVFITPKIVRNGQDQSDLVNKNINERVDFIQQNESGRDPYGQEVDRLPRRAAVEDESNEYIEDKMGVPLSPNANKKSGPAFREQKKQEKQETMPNNKPDSKMDVKPETPLDAEPTPGDVEEGE
jgi:general secretion pathway protein D